MAHAQELQMLLLGDDVALCLLKLMYLRQDSFLFPLTLFDFSLNLLDLVIVHFQ